MYQSLIWPAVLGDDARGLGCAARRRGCASAWRMRWSTVCGEMSSSAAISFDDRCWSTSRRQSSWPGAQPRDPAAMMSVLAAGVVRSRRLRRQHVRLLPNATPTPRSMRTPRARVPARPYVIIARNSPEFHGFARILINLSHGDAAGRSERRCALRAWWRGLDSNQRTLARADLQSAAFNHSATSPGEGRRAIWRRGL